MDREMMEMEDPGENERFIRRVIKELPEMPAAEDTEVLFVNMNNMLSGWGYAG